MKNLPPRRERRAAWRAEKRLRTPDEDKSWAASGLRAPILNPLQAHALAMGRRAGGQRTLEVALGFNRAQRLAMHSKKGPRRLLEHGRPTSTPAQSFLPGKGTWNRHALRIEGFRRLKARQDRYRRENVWWRRLWRLVRALPRLVRDSIRRAGRKLSARWQRRAT